MKKRRIIRIAALLAVFMTASVTAAEPAADAAIQSQIAVMTKEEKAGQMLMVSPSQLCEGDWTSQIDAVSAAVDFYHIGGIVFFQEDLQDPGAVQALKDALSQKAGIPVLTLEDAAGSRTSGYSKPENSPYVMEGTGEIWAYEMPVEAGAFAVVTHAKVPGTAAMDEGKPSSMARSMVTGTLRNEFTGLILTDSLSMPEATDAYGADMAVQYAFQAGNDMLTAPANLMNAYFGMLSAVDEQLVSPEQLDAAVTRILSVKAELGLM